MLTASGYVVARRKAAVASKGTGTLVFLGVEEGDRVKKGQMIARLDDSDVAATLQRARENLRVVESELNDADQSLKRQRVLLQKEMVARADYDVAEARYKCVNRVHRCRQVWGKGSRGRRREHAHRCSLRWHGFEKECGRGRDCRSIGWSRKL
jgi:multidrug resistance efflux pump